MQIDKDGATRISGCDAVPLCGARSHDDKYTPEGHLPTPGQREHSPQRHTAAGTAAPTTTTDTGNTVPQLVNPTQMVDTHSRKRHLLDRGWSYFSNALTRYSPPFTCSIYQTQTAREKGLLSRITFY